MTVRTEDPLWVIARRLYLAGIARGLVMGFCLGALVMWFAK